MRLTHSDNLGGGDSSAVPVDSDASGHGDVVVHEVEARQEVEEGQQGAADEAAAAAMEEEES